MSQHFKMTSYTFMEVGEGRFVATFIACLLTTGINYRLLEFKHHLQRLQMIAHKKVQHFNNISLNRQGAVFNDV
jgi:hypothetical protein